MTVFAVASALLLYLSFPNFINSFGFWPLGWIFAIPLLVALEQKRLNERLKAGFIFGFISYALLLSWLFPLNVFGYLAMVVVFSIQPVAFGILYRTISFPEPTRLMRVIGQIGNLFFVPALWVATEFLRSILLGGFSWTVGHSQSFFPVNIQLASVSGSYGISFVLILFSCCLYRILRDFSRMYFYGALSLAAVSFICAYGYFSIEDGSSAKITQKAFEICAVQPNISPEVKWDRTLLDQVVDEHIQLTLGSLNGRRPGPDLVVWPETAIPDDFIKDELMRSKVTRLCQKLKTHLLLGAALYENDRYYNSAVLLNGQGTVLDIYRKKYLIPFSEYLPWGRTLAFMRQLFNLNVVDFYRGKSPGIMTLGKAIPRKTAAEQKFGVAICSEDGYPGLFRKLVAERAGFIIVMLNDAWFKQRTALAFHVQMSIMRAVENRIQIVRVANSGWSCAIAPTGQIHSSLRDPQGNFLNIRGVGTFFVFPGSPKTFYNQYGDIFAVICLGFVIISLIIHVIQPRKNKTL